MWAVRHDPAKRPRMLEAMIREIDASIDIDRTCGKFIVWSRQLRRGRAAGARIVTSGSSLREAVESAYGCWLELKGEGWKWQTMSG